MNTPTNIRSYDWATWAMGIMRAIIGGGGGAIAALTITTGTGFYHIIISMVKCFFIVGVIHMGIFLETHSGPEVVTTEVKQTTVHTETTETTKTPGDVK